MGAVCFVYGSAGEVVEDPCVEGSYHEGFLFEMMMKVGVCID